MRGHNYNIKKTLSEDVGERGVRGGEGGGVILTEILMETTHTRCL